MSLMSCPPKAVLTTGPASTRQFAPSAHVALQHVRRTLVAPPPLPTKDEEAPPAPARSLPTLGAFHMSLGGEPMNRRSPLRPLAIALSLALVAPGVASGQTAKEKELEARIAQLEAQVQALLQQQQQTEAAVAATRPKPDEARVATASDGKPAIQRSPILTAGNPGSVFSYGGFIKLGAMVTDTGAGAIAEGSAGRMFYVPSTIPVTANGAEPDTDPYTDFHAAFSRFWLAADWTSEGGDKFRGFIEADMFGGGPANLGNEVSTNTHGITIRHAYVTWNKWLAGQTWSNFQDVAALPEAVDFVGVTEGTTF